MSSALCSSSIPEGTTSTIYEPAAQRVYQAPELLQIIVHCLQKQDLVNLALVSKEGFIIPASELYARSSHHRLSDLFDQGCNSDRFAIYIKGVRDLEIPTIDTADQDRPVLDLPRWLGQYPGLRRIRMRVPYVLNGENLYSVDQYHYQGRVIKVEGFRTPQRGQGDILAADQPPFKLLGYPTVTWLGCLELLTQDLPSSDLTLVIDSIIAHVTPRSMPRPSPWSTLRKLNLEPLDLPLPRLEVLLRGCPRLDDLSCVLSCSGGDTGRYMTTLTDILRRFGSSLMSLDCRTKGACVLMFARHLGVIPEIVVNGTLWWAKTKAMIGNGLSFAEPKPLEGAKAKHVWLHLRMPTGWLQQSVHEIPVPHEVAQYLRNIFPSRSYFGVRGADHRSGLTSHENLWIGILKATLRSLKAEDLKKAEAEGAAEVALV